MNKKYFFLITAIIIIFIYQLSQSVRNSLDSITTDLKNEETISLITPSENQKISATKGSTNSELIIAQQIERFLAFNHSNIAILENIYGNMDYYKNPTAVLFYLSYAYKQLGQYQKALALLDEIIRLDDTEYTFLYLFSSKRLDEMLYYVAVKAELILRKAEIYHLLNEDDKTLKLLNDMLLFKDISYGYGKLAFKYSDLAAKNIQNLQQSFISSSHRFYLAANAKHLVKSILTADSKKMIANYLSAEYSSLVFGNVYTQADSFLNDYELLKPKFAELPTANFKIDFISCELKDTADLYYFQVGEYYFEILDKLNQQYLLKLQKE